MPPKKRVKRWTADWDALYQRIEETQHGKKRQIILEELDKVRASYQEDIQRFEAETHELWQKNLKAEQDTLHHKMMREIKVVKKKADEENISLLGQCENMQNQYNVLVSVNLDLSTKLKKMADEMKEEREERLTLLEELDRVRASNQEDTQCYKAEILKWKQLADQLQSNLDKVAKDYANFASSHRVMAQNRRAMWETHCQIIAKEVATIEKTADEKSSFYLKQCAKLINQHNIQITFDPEFHTKLEEMTKENQVVSKDKWIVQEELDTVRASYQEETIRYEATKQQAEHLQSQLDKAIKTHADNVSCHELMLQKARAEWDALHQKIVKEITVVKQKAEEDNTLLWRQNENLQNLYSLLVSVNLELSKKIKMMTLVIQEEREEKQVLHEELGRVRKSQLALQRELDVQLKYNKLKKSKFKTEREDNAPSQKTSRRLPTMTELREINSQSEPTLCMRIREFLGLR
ncbi:hypothetical protein JOB18_048146 [Solea senegalensis]|uniref:Dynein regulatory complex protein 1/2 N-terminal domain-containing protein n=1 Tax=Solea senegalensis TaxID=28829 RepID=A0AAV6Q7P8_SOLSE|nr:hypothetical protein JOB18_048146 [Solea senegalensis]